LTSEEDRGRTGVHPDLLEADADDEAPLAPSAARRAELLATLAPATRLEGFVARLATFLDLAPARARELVRSIPEVREATWIDDRVAGVRLLHFAGGPRHAGSDCGLVHLAPGTRYPRHVHVGDEWSFVLSGSAEEEETGAVWSPGDLVRCPPGSAHAFRALGAEPFVFAVVLTNGIRIEEAIEAAR
jgi:quercetin dioxygenase-like cupin family protein